MSDGSVSRAFAEPLVHSHSGEKDFELIATSRIPTKECLGRWRTSRGVPVEISGLGCVEGGRTSYRSSVDALDGFARARCAFVVHFVRFDPGEERWELLATRAVEG